VACDATRNLRLLHDPAFRYALLCAQNYALVFLVWSIGALLDCFGNSCIDLQVRLGFD
jgi:hypothetical protein